MQKDTIQQGRSTRQGTGRDNLLGFVILTHDNPPQILRLINRLVSMFDNPPIVCHHDFSKCDLDTNLFPPNVSFVLPHFVRRGTAGPSSKRRSPGCVCFTKGKMSRNGLHCSAGPITRSNQPRWFWPS